MVRQLDDMTAKTICNHFTSLLAEFGLPSTVVADFGPQYISEMFKEKCNNSGIALIFHYRGREMFDNPTRPRD